MLQAAPPFATAVRPPERHGEQRGRAGDDQRIPQGAGGGGTKQQTGNADRHGGDDQGPGQSPLSAAAAAEGTGPARQQPSQIVPQANDHRQQTAKMGGNIMGQTLIRPSREHRQQNQMGRAGYGQKLRQPLQGP